MSEMNSARDPDAHWLRGVVLGAALVSASGCVHLPSPTTPQPLKPMDQLAHSRSLSAPTSTWPSDLWWQAYRDPQLDQLIGEALQESPDLAKAAARLRQAEAVLQSADATLKPEVTASASFTQEKQSYNHLLPRAAVPKGWNDFGTMGLNLSWEIDFWGKNRASLAAATSEQQAAEAELAQARLLLSTSVASAYLELHHLYAVRDPVSATLKLHSKRASLLRHRQRFGLENLAGVYRANAKQAAANAELSVIDERIALQNNAIAALLGAGPDRGLSITRPTVGINKDIGLPANLTLELLGRRPDIVAARLRTEAAAQRIQYRKAGFYPSINLLAVVGLLSMGLDNLTASGSEMGSVGPAISLPIFNTGRLQGALRGAYAEYDAAASSYNGTLSNALREVADAVTSRKALDGELGASRAAFEAAKAAQRIAQQRYKGELASYLEVLTAEEALLATQRTLTETQSRALTLNLALIRALGGGFQRPTS